MTTEMDEKGNPWHERFCAALSNEPCDCGLYEAYPDLAPEVVPEDE